MTTLEPVPSRNLSVKALTRYVNTALDRVLPGADAAPVELHRAMRYAALAGGKRLRPLLVYASGQVFGEHGPCLDAPACAVELIHAYSLIHDDLPAMDDDDLRRGQPTCHKVYGEAMAILAGDALQALAFELLAADDKQASTQIAMLHSLARACGSTGMAGGQAMDLAAVGTRLDLAGLERMHARKTGALIRASVELGAFAAGGTNAATLDILARYASAVGMAFQVRDDILDVEGDTTALGKTAGKDARAHKPTFPSILGMHASRAHLAALVEQALTAVVDLGPEAELLRTLAQLSADRES